MKVKDFTYMLGCLPQESEAELIVIDDNRIIFPQMIQTSVRSNGVVTIVLNSDNVED